MKASLETILSRHKSLELRPIDFEVFVHPEHDPGMYRRAHLFLKTFLNTHQYALALFDREGCGCLDPAATLAGNVQANLDQHGWRGRSAVVVIDPELEAWAWADSPHVAQALGWRSQRQLTTWLQGQGFLAQGQTKPARPKEAMKASLERVKEPMSAAIYQRIARHVTYARCLDPSFTLMKQILKGWFPEP